MLGTAQVDTEYINSMRPSRHMYIKEKEPDDGVVAPSDLAKLESAAAAEDDESLPEDLIADPMALFPAAVATAPSKAALAIETEGPAEAGAIIVAGKDGGELIAAGRDDEG